MEKIADSNFIWYAAYGSNITRIDRYLNDINISTIPNSWESYYLHLYFAGKNQAWNDQAVAFVYPWSPSEIFQYQTDISYHKQNSITKTISKVYRITKQQFEILFQKENCYDFISIDYTKLGEESPYELLDISAVPLAQDEDNGKYNGIIRLPDKLYKGVLENVYTITTARKLQHGTPDSKYLEIIKNGIREIIDHNELEHYINNALNKRISVGNIKVCNFTEAILDDIEDADEISISKGNKSEYSKWILVNSGVIACPMKVRVRTKKGDEYCRNRNNLIDDEKNLVNLSYAGRTLLGINKIQKHLLYQKLDEPINDLKKKISSFFNKIGERLIGAPTVTLRTFEGLVGDDNDLVVRVDENTLTQIGVSAGDRVYLSWAEKNIKCRVLLQDEQSRKRMKEQLKEKGSQLRKRSSDQLIENRKTIPWHLTVWVSATIRSRLQIPTDTLIRIRRNTWFIVWKNLPQLSIPVLGVILSILELDTSKYNYAILIVSMIFVLVMGLSVVNTIRIQNRRKKYKSNFVEKF